MTKTAKQLFEQALKLSDDERIEFAMALLESSAEWNRQPDEAEQKFIDRCVAEYEANPEAVTSWEEVQRRWEDERRTRPEYERIVAKWRGALTPEALKQIEIAERKVRNAKESDAFALFTKLSRLEEQLGKPERRAKYPRHAQRRNQRVR